MLLITLSIHATVGAELLADEILKARRATAQRLRLSEPLLSVTGCGGIVSTPQFICVSAVCFPTADVTESKKKKR